MELVDIVVHYGTDNVGVTESGVDMSEFGNILIQLTVSMNLSIAANCHSTVFYDKFSVRS